MLKNHKKYCAGTTHECEECGKVLKTYTQLRWHLELHADANAFGCDFCDYKATRPADLRKHKKNMHGEVEDYVCETCGDIFNNPASLKSHNNIHLGTQVFQCDCGKVFKRLLNATKHLTCPKRTISPAQCARRLLPGSTTWRCTSKAIARTPFLVPSANFLSPTCTSWGPTLTVCISRRKSEQFRVAGSLVIFSFMMTIRWIISFTELRRQLYFRANILWKVLNLNAISLVSTHVCKVRLQNYLLEILNQIQGRCLLSGEWLEKPTLPLGPELAWELLLYSTFLHSRHHRPYHHCHHHLLASPYHLQYQYCPFVTWLKSGGNFLTSRPSYFLLFTTSNIGGQEFCMILWANISKANRTVPLSFWTWSIKSAQRSFCNIWPI